MAEAGHGRVHEIDLLRFTAAMAVLFYHYAFRGYAADGLSAMPLPLLAPVAKYGYLGVELFFMISGFVILMSVRGGSLRAFVISRCVRLYPAFWACCSLTFVLLQLCGATQLQLSGWQFLANLTMLSGFAGVPLVDGAYWSLLVEMRFYALVALLLWLGQLPRAQWWLGCWLVVVVLDEWLGQGRLRSLLIVDYAAYFVAGAVCYLIWERGASPARLGLLLACWGLALFQSLRALAPFEQHYATAMNRPVVAGLITLFFLALLLVALRRTGMLGRRSWTLAGALTYPVYLLHQNIGYALFNLAYPRWPAPLLLLLVTLLVLALAYGVHRGVERRYATSFKRCLNHWFDLAQARWAQGKRL